MPRTSIPARPVLALVAISALTGTIAGCTSDGSASSAAAEGESLTLRLADGYPPTHYYSVNGPTYFADKVAELTDGRVSIEVYPGGQLGETTDMIDVLNQGVADIAFTAPGYLPAQMPMSGAFSLPRVLPSSEVGTRAYAEAIASEDSVIRQVDYAANGLVPLFVGIAADYQLMSSSRSIETVDDVEGQTIRSAGGTVDLITKALGASPITIATGDIYNALENGTVDANLQGPPGAIGNSLHEVVQSITTNGNFTAFVSAWTITEEKFDSLPEDVRDALVEAGAATSERLAEIGTESTEEAMAEFEAAGATLVEYGPDELAELDAKLAAIPDEWRDSLSSASDGAEAITEMTAAVEHAQAG